MKMKEENGIRAIMIGSLKAKMKKLFWRLWTAIFNRKYKNEEKLRKLIDQLVIANPEAVKEYKKLTKTKAFNFLVGQTIKISEKRANPEIVKQILFIKLFLEE